MRQTILSLLSVVAFTTTIFAQSGCPGCLTQLPPALSNDTIFIEKIPDGEKGKAYDADLSFRLPKTTTPVSAIDPSIPAGLPISKFEIAEVQNVPPGLLWQANQTVFETSSLTDGCIKLCGIPTFADTFIILVKLKVSVLFFTQDHTVPLRMVVHPKSSSTTGFQISAVEGCPPLTVQLTNNLPSGGNVGYQYAWQWGNSTQFLGENPPLITFTEAGIYPIRYQATIDTSPFLLTAIKILAVECVDQLGTGAPDLYFFVKDKSGNLVIPPAPDISNAPMPNTFKTNLPLTDGNYTLEVWDEDSGLKGSDDLCGRITFNYLMGGDTLVSGNFKAILTIEKPIEVITSIDTVRVFPLPATPTVQFPGGLTQCEGETKVVLVSSPPNNNVWLKNGEIIPNSFDFLLVPTSSGMYAVRVQNSFGCTAKSEEVEVIIHPLPAVPVFYNDRNRQIVKDTSALPANFALQWFQFNAPIAGATGLTYCVQATGVYQLEVTDLTTGCTRVFSEFVQFDPQFDCTVGTNNLIFRDLVVYPNPTTDRVTLQLPENYILPTSSSGGTVAVQVADFSGKIVRNIDMPIHSNTLEFSMMHLPTGMFWVSVRAENGVVFRAKIVKI